MYALFSTAYYAAAHWFRPRATEAEADAFSRFWRYDDNLYLALLCVLGLEMASPALDNPYLWLAITYLGLVGMKGAVLAAYAYHVLRSNEPGTDTDAASTPPSPKRPISFALKALLLIAALLVYIGISAYHIHRTSLTGDEPHYLLITHSLWHDRDTNLYNNYEQRDYEAFFWYDLKPAWGDQVSETEIYSYRHSGGFPHLLIPGYALGGQWGAVLQMNLIAALLMAQVFLLAYDLFQSIPAAFLAWLTCAFTVPSLVYMGQLYPEMPAALFTILAVRLIRRLAAGEVANGAAFWRHAGLMALWCTALLALKTRYLPIAAMLALAWLIALIRVRWRGKRMLIALAWLPAVGLVGGGIIMLIDRVVFDGAFWERLRDLKFMAYIFSGHNPLYGALGLLFDQEYGLLTYTPLYAASLLGFGFMTRREWRAYWPIVGALAVNYAVIAAWPLWHAAPTPPSRYILPILPVCAAFAARCFLANCRAAHIIIGGVGSIWSGLMAWFLTLSPGLRYNWADGTSHALETASLSLAVNLLKLFPSWIRLSPLTPFTTALALLLLGLLAYVCRRASRLAAGRPAGPWPFVSILLVMIGFLGTVGLGMVAGKMLPTMALEMEDPLDARHHGGVREPESLDPWDNQHYLRTFRYAGWKLWPGDSLEMRPSLPRGPHTARIHARAVLAHDAKVPRLEVRLNGHLIGDVPITSEDWQAFSFDLDAAESRPLLEVRCADDVNTEHAIVIDKIRF